MDTAQDHPPYPGHPAGLTPPGEPQSLNALQLLALAIGRIAPRSAVAPRTTAESR